MLLGSKRIKGITIEIDGNFTSLDKATEGYNRRLKETQSQLNDVEKLLKLDPKNTELLAQKQKLLAEQSKLTTDKLSKLHTAQKQAEPNLKNYDAWKAKIEPINRQIQETNDSLRAMQKEQKKIADSDGVDSKCYQELSDKIKDARKELKSLKDAQKSISDEFGNPVGQDQYDALRREIIQTERALSKLEETTGNVKEETEGFGDVFNVNLAVEGIEKISDTLKEVVEGSREYRTEMAKLQTAYEANNHSADTAKRTYDELYAILGDTGQAVEAANHLALLAENEKTLMQWTEIAAGVYGTFGASLPIESLTEAANETAKTGKITGSLADALNWAGIQEDGFQQKLDKCASESERVTLITNTLSKSYEGAAKSFRSTNKDIIESNRASGKLQDSLAKLGKKVEPIFTALTKVTAKLVGVLDDGAPVVAGLIAAMATGKIISFAKALDLAAIKQNILNMAQKASPAALIIGGIVGVTTALFAFAGSADKAEDECSKLNNEADQLIDTHDELRQKIADSASALKEANEAHEENAKLIANETDETEDLWKELRTLADETGNVDGANRDRADYILGRLNEALGTEYTLNGNIIGQYQQMQDEIALLIQMRQAERLLNSAEAGYTTAVGKRPELLQGLKEASFEWESANNDLDAELWEAALSAMTDEEFNAFYNKYHFNYSDRAYKQMAQEDSMQALAEFWRNRYGKEYSDAQIGYMLQTSFDAMMPSYMPYREAQTALDNNTKTITSYETAEKAVISGDYATAIDLLTDKTSALWDAVERGEEISAEGLDSLRKDLTDTDWEIRNYYDRLMQGVDGYSVEGLRALVDGFEEKRSLFEEYTGEAFGFGENIMSAVIEGIASMSEQAVSAAANVAARMFDAAENVAEIASPSKRGIRDGKYIAKGFGIGITDGMREALESARTFADSLLSTMHIDHSALMQNAYLPASISAIPSHSATTYHSSTSLGGIVVNVNAPNVSDVAQLAELVADRINDSIVRKVAVYE